MKGEELRAAIAQYIDVMPSLPTSIGKVLEICRQPNALPADLNKVISLDPVLLGRVMKLINSAYYGLGQEVTSLARAIIMLGLNTVKNLALSTAVLGTVNSVKVKASVLNLESFWLHSLCVGVTAKLIAKARGIDPKDTEAYFICGLLHDIGKIPLNNKVPEIFLQSVQAGDRMRAPLVNAEAATFDFTHQEAGALVIQNWQLGEEIMDCVAFHHTPLEYTGNYRDVLYAVVVANYYANITETGFSGDRFPVKPPAAVFEYLGLNWLQVEALEDAVNQEIGKAKVFLKLSG